MAAYNFTKRADRDLCRAVRQTELDAVNNGVWPRDINDLMRWLHAPTSCFLSPAHNQDIQREYTARMCRAEIDYLDGVDRRVAEGDPELAGWEA